eukprot:TRINITY_DN5757_c0_g1_i1.p1 TRINITY_DN5757_c0_g1~~TRINITY_DN5757_c0_g1_i1.p1  ORF type:complete len:412 (+),score=59.80 TRINITY_DN5757_c0_g1_i1:50-1237(+)
MAPGKKADGNDAARILSSMLNKDAKTHIHTAQRVEKMASPNKSRRNSKTQNCIQISLQQLIPDPQPVIEIGSPEADGDFHFRFSQLSPSLDIADFMNVLKEMGITGDAGIYKVEILGRGCIEFRLRSSRMARQCRILAGKPLSPGSPATVVDELGFVFHTPQATISFQYQQDYLAQANPPQDSGVLEAAESPAQPQNAGPLTPGPVVTNHGTAVKQDYQSQASLPQDSGVLEAAKSHVRPQNPGPVTPGPVVTNHRTAMKLMPESQGNCLFTSLLASEAEVACQDQAKMLKKCSARVSRVQQTADVTQKHPMPPGPTSRLITELLATAKSADNNQQAEAIFIETRTCDVEDESNSTEASDQAASHPEVDRQELFKRMMAAPVQPRAAQSHDGSAC